MSLIVSEIEGDQSEVSSLVSLVEDSPRTQLLLETGCCSQDEYAGEDLVPGQCLLQPLLSMDSRRLGGSCVIAARLSLAAEPTPGKACSSKTTDDVGAASHQTPDEFGTIVLDHQNDRTLIQTIVALRDPSLV